MFGLMRKPCRVHQPELADEWMKYMCGACLAIGDLSSTAYRATLNTDAVFLSAFVDSLSGNDSDSTIAGRCALRGFRQATVTTSGSNASQVGAFVSLLLASTKVADDMADGDKSYTRMPFITSILARAQQSVAGHPLVGLLDTDALQALISAETDASRRGDHAAVVSSIEAAYGMVFSWAAAVAERPEVAPHAMKLGASIGKLAIHLDSYQDRQKDARNGMLNMFDGMTDEQSANKMLEVVNETTVTSRQALSDLDLGHSLLLGSVIEQTANFARETVANNGKAPSARKRHLRHRSEFARAATAGKNRILVSASIAPILASVGCGCDVCDCCCC